MTVIAATRSLHWTSRSGLVDTDFETTISVVATPTY